MPLFTERFFCGEEVEIMVEKEIDDYEYLKPEKDIALLFLEDVGFHLAHQIFEEHGKYPRDRIQVVMGAGMFGIIISEEFYYRVKVFLQEISYTTRKVGSISELPLDVQRKLRGR